MQVPSSPNHPNDQPLNPNLLIDLEAENRLLTQRLQPVLVQAKGTTAEEFSEGINSFNQARLEQLREAFAEAFAVGEDRERILKRVKDVYNQAHAGVLNR
jgi:hypothetical protein